MTTQPTHVPSAIPTTYRGVRMRSRLEARWAAFFDAVAWPWRYEPVDLDGYIPDFVLDFEPGHIAVEVKPLASLVEMRPHAERMVRAGWRGEVLVVGETLFRDDAIGLFGDDWAARDGGAIEFDAAIAFFCISCGAASLRSESFSHRCRRCGVREGHVGALVDDSGDPTLVTTWNAAGNRVQWRAPK